MLSQIHFEWEERGISQNYNDLIFDADFSVAGDSFYFAEIDPPIDIGNETVRFTQFKTFAFASGNLTFYTHKTIRVPLPENISELKLSIVKPVPVPLKESWNKDLEREDEFCHVNLFFHPQEETSQELRFIKTIGTQWSNLKGIITTIMKESEFGQFGKSIGIISEAEKVPILVPMNDFFADNNSYKKGKLFMSIAVSSFKEFTLNYKGKILPTKGVPQIPKDLLLRKLKMIAEKENLGQGIDKYSRRLLKALFTAAIPVSLFDKDPKLLVDPHSNYFKSADFQRCVFNLDWNPGFDYEKLLQLPIENLKSHVFHGSNEATLRSLVWDIILSRLFLCGDEDRLKNYTLSSEWKTRELFPSLEDRRVDFEASINLNGVNRPVLLVEIGTDPFDSRNPHKDFSKLINIMSLSCISLSRELASQKKAPEDARVYGLWIGGLTAQLCVAHPVVTDLKNGTSEIHSNVTFEDEWILNLLSSDGEVSNVSLTSTPEWLEKLVPGRISNQDYIFTNLQFSEDTSIAVSDALSSAPGPEFKGEASVPMTTCTNPSGRMYSGNLNLKVLRKLHCFIEIVKARINLMLAEETEGEKERYKDRDFGDLGNFGFFDSARESSTSETPSKSRISGTMAGKRETEPSSPILRKKIITKTSMKELEILLKLSKFSEVFVRMFSFVIDEEDSGDGFKIRYEFEKMTPLFERSTGKLNDFFNCHHKIDLIFNCVQFSVQCLYGLFCLHEEIDVIHSDISANNIMYSDIDRRWKIIDFDQSEYIRYSLTTPRTAGTRGFIAPEAETDGIFTKKSDIYSLGQVLVDYLNPLLIEEILLDETGEVDADLRLWFKSFNLIILKMIRPNPDERPSVFECLEEMFKLLYQFTFAEEDSKYNDVKGLLFLKSEMEKYVKPSHLHESLEAVHLHETLQSTEEAASEFFESKKAKLTEEKEQPLPKNLQQNVE